jgi:YD repeat-containing protein
MVKAENAARLYEFEYDALGRLAKSRDRDLGETISYAYDAEGQRSSLSWGRNRQVKYEYGKAGELAAVIDPDGGRTEYLYDAAYREISRKLPNGLRTRKSYDGAGRLSAIKTDGEGRAQERRLSNEAYVYDASGKRAYTVDEEGRITAYGYDDRGRLAKVLYPMRTGKVSADFDERLDLGLYPEYRSLRALSPGGPGLFEEVP